MDNKTMKACLHLYFSICLNTYTGKKNPVFKIQKTLAPVWWGLVVWRWSLVATVSVLLIACSSVTCFYSFQITQKLAWRNYRFPILLAAEGKPWWPGVPHQLAMCVGHPSLAGLRAATVCAALSTPGCSAEATQSHGHSCEVRSLGMVRTSRGFFQSKQSAVATSFAHQNNH